LNLINPYRFGSSGGDPYFANVVSLLHFDGANGSTTITDVIPGRTWTTTGTAVISTAQSVFGGSSLEMSNTGTNRIDCTDSAFNFGTADFTIEMRMRPNATAGRAAFSFGTRLVYITASGWAYFNGSNFLVGGSNTANVWYSLALVRASGVMRLYINGASSVTYGGDAAALNPGTIRIGYYNAGNTAGQYYEEFRCTVGVARYTSSYTPDVLPFPDS
jgi:hypothetical protein